MELELQLKIQALIDGELTGRERRDVEVLLKCDEGARRLRSELEGMRLALRGNEPWLKLPENGEFFWAKVSEGIARQEDGDRPGARSTAASWWIRLLAPVGAGAALMALLFSADIKPPAATGHVQTQFELPAGGFTYYAADEDMTVVWVDTGVN